MPTVAGYKRSGSLNADRVDTLVLLAAGPGSRQGRLPVPKAWLRIRGLPLLYRNLRLFCGAGIRRVIIVTGRLHERWPALLGRIRHAFPCTFQLVHNLRWHCTQNGDSLRLALPYVGKTREFLFAMADHLFAPEQVRLILQTPAAPLALRLVVDPQPGPWIDLEEATRVRFASGHIQAIGKGLEPWEAIDTGLFRASPRFFRYYPHRHEGIRITEVVQRAAGAGQAGVLVVPGAQWTDLDTPLDRYRAAALVAGTAQTGL